jgi:hypothetical protein
VPPQIPASLHKRAARAGAEVQRVPQRHHQRAAAPLLSVEVQRWHNDTSLHHKQQQHLGRAQRFSAAGGTTASSAGSSSTSAGHTGFRGCRGPPPPSPCLAQRTRQHGPQWAELRKGRTPLPVTMPVVKQSSPHSNGQPRPRSRQPAAAITPALSPGPLWFLLPPTPPRRQLQRLPNLRAFSSTASQACRSTQRQLGRQQSAVCVARASYGLCCHP